MNVQAMISAHPKQPALDADALRQCIEACYECAQTCTSCADACLAEDQVDTLKRCIRLNLDCADVCDVTGRVLSRLTERAWDLLRAQVGSCYRACGECAQECEMHAEKHGHCRVCAEACRGCEEACSRLLKALEETAIGARQTVTP